jgi:hypothetical protein
VVTGSGAGGAVSGAGTEVGTGSVMGAGAGVVVVASSWCAAVWKWARKVGPTWPQPRSRSGATVSRQARP